jgi:hypothetical protein
MFYRAAVRKIDSPLFHEAGTVILTWAVDDAQPTATVLTSQGAFSTLLQHTACKLGHPLLYEGRRI